MDDLYSGIARLRSATLEDKPLKQNTIRDYIGAIKRFSLWMTKNHLSAIPEHDLWTIKVPKPDTMTVTAEELLTAEEVRAMILACQNSRDRALIAVLYGGGFRIKELATLIWSQVLTGGTGLYDESLSLFSVGAGAAAATCGVEALQADAANYTAVPYCESVITGTSFSVNGLVYRSQGSVSQADDVMPDSLGFVVLSTGSGSGTFFARSGSMAGIGPGGELGYTNGVTEVLSVGGRFELDGGVQWTSFSGVNAG